MPWTRGADLIDCLIALPRRYRPRPRGRKMRSRAVSSRYDAIGHLLTQHRGLLQAPCRSRTGHSLSHEHSASQRQGSGEVFDKPSCINWIISICGKSIYFWHNFQMLSIPHYSHHDAPSSVSIASAAKTRLPGGLACKGQEGHFDPAGLIFIFFAAMVGTTLNQSRSPLTLPGYNCRVYVFEKGSKFSQTPGLCRGFRAVQFWFAS